MAFYNDEYKHLLAAERAIAAEIDSPGEDSNIAMLARALVDVIDQKRVMRGQPAPKPIDMTRTRKKRASGPVTSATLDGEPLPVAEPAAASSPAPPANVAPASPAAKPPAV